MELITQEPDVHYGEILHGGKLFGQFSGADELLAIRRQLRLFMKNPIFSPKRSIKHF